MQEETDNGGKFELALRILGNELVALKISVDDFKMKWLFFGIVAIVALGWTASSFGPSLVKMFSGV